MPPVRKSLRGSDMGAATVVDVEGGSGWLRMLPSDSPHREDEEEDKDGEEDAAADADAGESDRNEAAMAGEGKGD